MKAPVPRRVEEAISPAKKAAASPKRKGRKTKTSSLSDRSGFLDEGV
jgi:hypothetical protein